MFTREFVYVKKQYEICSRNFFRDVVFVSLQVMLATTVGLVMPVNERIRENTGVQQGLWGRNSDKATSLYAAVKLAF